MKANLQQMPVNNLAQLMGDWQKQISIREYLFVILRIQ